MKDYIAVEDNAVILAKYDKGLAICEASWTTHGFGYELMINGSGGTVRSDGRSVQIARNSGEVPQTVEVKPLPDYRRNAAAHFLTCIEENVLPRACAIRSSLAMPKRSWKPESSLLKRAAPFRSRWCPVDKNPSQRALIQTRHRGSFLMSEAASTNGNDLLEILAIGSTTNPSMCHNRSRECTIELAGS